MSAHVLLNVSNEQRKRNNTLYGFAKHVIVVFRNEFN